MELSLVAKILGNGISGIGEGAYSSSQIENSGEIKNSAAENNGYRGIKKIGENTNGLKYKTTSKKDTDPNTFSLSGLGEKESLTEGADAIVGEAGAAEGAEAVAAVGSLSDERLKRITNGKQDIIDLFSKINAIQFSYNNKAHQLYGEEVGVDSDEHTGVKAQELAQNPITSSAVIQDPDTGYLTVDTREMTLTNSAVLSDVCKRLIAIEKALGMEN